MRNAPDRVVINQPPSLVVNDGAPEWDYESGIRAVYGRFSVLDVEEAPLWQNEKVTACVRLALGTSIERGDRIVIDRQTYLVSSVRPNLLHLRVMLREVTA